MTQTARADRGVLANAITDELIVVRLRMLNGDRLNLNASTLKPQR